MKNHNKASLPKIQIKQVQVLNRAINTQSVKNYTPTYNPTTETLPTATGF